MHPDAMHIQTLNATGVELLLFALNMQDVRFERRLLKERQQEDHLFEGKDKFITSAYRKKLEEDKKWVEDQKQKCVKTCVWTCLVLPGLQ